MSDHIVKWTDDREREIEALRQLLNDVALLNHGSDVCGRIERCEKAGRALLDGDINTGRKSFVQFLIELAVEDRQKRWEKP